MIRKLKNSIRGYIHNRCYDKYLKETERQKDCYRQWYLENEAWSKKPLRGNGDVPSVGMPGENADIILFLFSEGILADGAKECLAEFFRLHPEAELVYADEDRTGADGKRTEPWFKPVWSPDTFDSFCYFGNLAAVRRKWVAEYSVEETKKPDFLRKVTEEITADYLGKHRNVSLGQIPANEENGPIRVLDKVLFHVSGWSGEAGQEWETRAREDAGPEEAEAVSIIIPSRDNPLILEKCVRSIREITRLEPRAAFYEIIVVDNGSGGENKEKIQDLGKRYGFRYVYRPMEFNFSAMCNLGAGEASGEFLLFLNDDIEVIHADWLEKLWRMARKSHVGAVGAKLLFPGGDLIQHAGVTNLDVGPAHKLLKADDKISYYHGQNRHNYDMIGVTAACLMVRGSVFDQAEGFYEGIQVSYNDVDFCFKLYELGYYNVLRNDVVLYHHESLSRGDDNLSEDKWRRLLSEKELLYQRHPGLRGYDPFYSRNLAQHTHVYGPNYQYEYEKRDRITPVRPWTRPEPLKWLNPCLVVNVEHCRLQKKLDINEKNDSFWIEGWSYVMGSDNALYDRKLLLLGDSGRIYELPVLTRYRKDVADILPEQENVELSGFVCGIPVGTLERDDYVIAMLARDLSSRVRLYARTGARLMAGEDYSLRNETIEQKG